MGLPNTDGAQAQAQACKFGGPVNRKNSSEEPLQVPKTVEVHCLQVATHIFSGLIFKAQTQD